MKLVSNVCLSILTTFVVLFEVDREDGNDHFCPVSLNLVGKTGWSWTELWICLSIGLN